MDKLPLNIKEALIASGVDLLDCSSSKPSASDFLLLEEMHQFTFLHRPASTGIILISSDRDFGRRLSFLGKVGYDLMLVHGKNISETLTIIVEQRMLWQDVCRLHMSMAQVNHIQPYTPIQTAFTPSAGFVEAHSSSSEVNMEIEGQQRSPSPLPSKAGESDVGTSRRPPTPVLQAVGSTSNDVKPSIPLTGPDESVAHSSPSSASDAEEPTQLSPSISSNADITPLLGLATSSERILFYKSWLDFFVVYGLLHWVDRMCIHLVPGHAYPENTFNGLVAMQGLGLLAASNSLDTNPPRAVTYLFLTRKGQALFTLLKAVNLATTEQNGRKAFRPAVYFWIHFALTNDREDICRVSVLGGKVKPLITAGTLKDHTGSLFPSVTAYFHSAAAKGVFTLSAWGTSGDYLVKLKSPYNGAWRAFKSVSDQEQVSTEPWQMRVACGADVVERVTSALRSYSPAELLFLPITLVQLEATAVRNQQLYHLNKMLGYASGVSSVAAQRAGFIVSVAGGGSRLTSSGDSIVQRFERAAGRGWD
ncbi:hypothetical protein CALCODRAFT_194416 [Calocera cornea HHB12733]|uniref:NYN domain-containing protein n=1 Tax=Calocera cornea HHB12733 TaxID=1353952 RepID=A0A165HI49_9BASI|nr:hypothetical protein CALCODRAFT_194416 [Calocera cornea HHB12733]